MLYNPNRLFNCMMYFKHLKIFYSTLLFSLCTPSSSSFICWQLQLCKKLSNTGGMGRGTAWLSTKYNQQQQAQPKKNCRKKLYQFLYFPAELSAIYMSHGIKSTPHSPFRPTKPINASVKAEINKKEEKKATWKRLLIGSRAEISFWHSRSAENPPVDSGQWSPR